MESRLITIAVSVAFQDAGEATRSLEIMNSVRANIPDGYAIRALFFSHGSKFDKNAMDNGFEIYHVNPPLEGKGYLSDLKPTANNFIGEPQLAIKLLEGEIEALKRCRPDLVVYGFWPTAGLARRMVSPPVPGICFLPLPLSPSAYRSGLMKDLPEQIRPLSFLPVGIRQKIMKMIPASLALKAPILRQSNLLNAAKQCGWNGVPLANLFDLLTSDLTLVNDLAEFYRGVLLPPNYVITGPVYAQSATDQELDPAIEAVFQKSNKRQVNLFCTMGSSAKKEFLIEAVKAVCRLPQHQFHAVILVPSAICPLTEITPLIQSANIYATDQFVPAARINAMADITLCHGGQGTLQTAMVCGCPVVGFAMQPEQQINLDHIVFQGAGMRIPVFQWNQKNITKAIKKVLSSNSYKENALRLGQMMTQTDGKLSTARAIWTFIENRFVSEGKGHLWQK